MKYLLIFVGFVGLSLAQEPSSILDAKRFERPKRDFSIIATESGYFPKSLSVYVGEQIRFYVTSSASKDQCFLVKDHPIYLSAKLGRIDEGEVEFKSPGRFEYYCPTTSFKGVITVLPKVDYKKKSLSRMPSSYDKKEGEERPKDYWTPRDS